MRRIRRRVKAAGKWAAKPRATATGVGSGQLALVDVSCGARPYHCHCEHSPPSDAGRPRSLPPARLSQESADRHAELSPAPPAAAKLGKHSGRMASPRIAPAFAACLRAISPALPGGGASSHCLTSVARIGAPGFESARPAADEPTPQPCSTPHAAALVLQRCTRSYVVRAENPINFHGAVCRT